MNFVTRRDIQAPQEFVFDQVVDFAAFERQALRRGIDVVRTSQTDADPASAAWDIKFTTQGRQWAIDAQVVSFDPNNGYVIQGVSNGVDVTLTVDLLALSRNTTRLTLTVALAPRGLSARLMMQPLKLVRATIQGKIDARIDAIAKDIEQRHGATG